MMNHQYKVEPWFQENNRAHAEMLEFLIQHQQDISAGTRNDEVLIGQPKDEADEYLDRIGYGQDI